MSVVDTTEVGYSFLTSGPRFRFSLPSDFDRLPFLSSPIRGANGGRSYDFVPALHDVGRSDPGHTHVSDLTDKDGRTVEVYERLEKPTLWWLRWPLQNGALYTHLREEDGLATANTVVASISVVEDPGGGTPSVLPDPPLRRGASTRAGYQEEAIYFSSERGALWSVDLKRPGYVAQGKILQVPPEHVEGRAVFRGGAAAGLEVNVTADTDQDEGRRIAAMIIESLREA